MKKLFLILFAVLLASTLVFSACGETKPEESSEEPAVSSEEEPVGSVAGGWTLNDRFDGTELSEKEETVFKVTEGLDGASYSAVACIATQVVAGTNYNFLATTTAVVPDAKPQLAEVFIYEDLEGKCEVKETKPLDVQALIEQANAAEGVEEAKKEEAATGGYTITQTGGIILPGQALQAFGDATKDLKDVQYYPLALLGTQVVAGTNYAVLAREEAADTNRLVIAIVYSDLEGNSSINKLVQWDY